MKFISKARAKSFSRHEFSYKVHTNRCIAHPHLVHAMIRDAQENQGLRHDDHQRYRQYCTRKLGRLGRNPSDNQKMILVFKAERSWAYGMQLRREAMTEARKVFHSRNRFKKAVGWGEGLVALCEPNSRECLEAKVLNIEYYSLLNQRVRLTCIL